MNLLHVNRRKDANIEGGKANVSLDCWDEKLRVCRSLSIRIVCRNLLRRHDPSIDSSFVVS